MFKNRAIQVKMVNTKNVTDEVENTSVQPMNTAEIAEIATEFMVKTVGAIGAVIVANKVLSTISEIALIAAKAKIK